MRFKIKEIGEHGLSLDLPVSGSWLAAECPDLDAKPAESGLKVKGQLLCTRDDVFLRANLRGALEVSCARCLETARVALDVPLMVTFTPKPEERDSDSEDDADDDAPDVAHYEGDEVDLSNEIRDQILLALPIKPLCKEGCLGLCAVCGGNRNQIPCDCESRAAAAKSPLATKLGKLKI